MDVVLKHVVRPGCLVFIDDVIIFSRSVQEHAQRLEIILQIFDKSKLKLHTGKCVFPQLQLNHVVFLLSKKRVSSLPPMIKAARNYNTP